MVEARGDEKSQASDNLRADVEHVLTHAAPLTDSL